jgi:hypothetical protein
MPTRKYFPKDWTVSLWVKIHSIRTNNDRIMGFNQIGGAQIIMSLNLNKCLG